MVVLTVNDLRFLGDGCDVDDPGCESKLVPSLYNCRLLDIRSSFCVCVILITCSMVIPSQLFF